VHSLLDDAWDAGDSGSRVYESARRSPLGGTDARKTRTSYGQPEHSSLALGANDSPQPRTSSPNVLAGANLISARLGGQIELTASGSQPLHVRRQVASATFAAHVPEVPFPRVTCSALVRPNRAFRCR